MLVAVETHQLRVGLRGLAQQGFVIGALKTGGQIVQRNGVPLQLLHQRAEPRGPGLLARGVVLRPVQQGGGLGHPLGKALGKDFKRDSG